MCSGTKCPGLTIDAPRLVPLGVTTHWDAVALPRQRLVLDRELELFDGTRLITAEHYAALEAEGVVPPAAEAVAAFEASGRSVRARVRATGM